MIRTLYTTARLPTSIDGRTRKRTPAQCSPRPCAQLTHYPWPPWDSLNIRYHEHSMYSTHILTPGHVFSTIGYSRNVLVAFSAPARPRLPSQYQHLDIIAAHALALRLYPCIQKLFCCALRNLFFPWFTVKLQNVMQW
ncbi:hypothetical protein COCVIDRAFT_112178 [Bipolaris victoriae FI3]|uniref:Uncharacterized protein n=2 Tax=Bipolaris TaxID=33194 RepID=W6Y8D2_COCC2|nr:uncharacterized protein COCCADRAFT_100833 [Bipolaris zeicola 26-R-13]XP_014551706.1 hypothetical protein COCVIDRAFT_112178 [Bipolaris victoriae FI3]EUC31624.1 hypothetical protein COCCADRAFT_100833 [Bipolaris zeicola 26-R-13]